MAITETYVDPSIAGDSGAGTTGDPYGDVQYALDTITRNATDGDRINVKAGTDEILGAALTLATYGTPSVSAPLIFQGYTTSQGDGGIGGIDGNSTYSMITPTSLDYVGFIDMHLHNSGTSVDIVTLDNGCFVVNCEIDGGNQGANLDNSLIANCYVHNCDNTGIDCNGMVLNNYLANGVSDFSIAIRVNANGSVIGNIISVDGSTKGIVTNNDDTKILNNSIYSNAGTGTGIEIQSSGDRAMIANNIVEGFSSVGGVGISIASKSLFCGYNAFYNNTTDFSKSGELYIDETANDQSLGASAFANAGTGDFTVGTSVKALAWLTANYPGLSVRSYTDMGALQREEAGGGGGGLLNNPGLTGGIRG